MISIFVGATNRVGNATNMPELSMVTDMYGCAALPRHSTVTAA